MAREDSNSQRREREKSPPSGGDSPGDRKNDGIKSPAPGSGVSSISTSDPALTPPSSNPERAVSFQTSQLTGPTVAYPFESDSGDVERREEGSEKNGKHRGQHDEKQRDDRPRHKGNRHQPSVNQPTWKTFVLVGVVALVCGVAGAWAYSAMFGPAKSDSQDKANKDKDAKQAGKSGGDKSSGKKSGGESGSGKGGSDKSGGAEGGASASEIPGFSSAEDAETFKKELEHLAQQVDLLGQRIDKTAQPEHEAPPGLHTLQMQVTELERTLNQVANVPSKMRQLEHRLSSVKEEIKMLKDRASGDDVPIGTDLSSDDLSPDDAPPDIAAPAPSSAADADPANNATLKLAIGLFREGHYSQAREVLRRLQRERPHDARVWYYSALTNGLSSGTWDGETKRLAEQGIERERAGTPSRAEIDEALAGLTHALGKDWMASQRRQAKER